MDNLFQLRQVTKTYRRGKELVGVFEELDFDVPAGEFYALMGPSGSGKTTLLNMLGGIDRATSGSICFKTDQLDSYSEAQLSKWRARNIGFIFQFYNLMPMLNARQNVELPMMLTNLSASARRNNVATALEIVGLSERSKHRPREMSGGQQQRVAIARALVADPDVLLCDEPTGDLDRDTATEILEILQLLNKELGKTIVMVTHDPVAASYAKKVLRLDKGRFIQEAAAVE